MKKGEKIIAVVVVVIVAILAAWFRVMHWKSQQSATTSWSLDNPSETFYSGMYYRDLTTDSWTSPLKTLAQEDDVVFHPDTEYYIFWSAPDMLKAEIENGYRTYDINIEYRFQSEDFAHIWIKVFNPDTGRVFVGMTSVLVDGEQCWKHCMGRSNIVTSMWPEFSEKGLEFTLYTSALPDAGPKVTDDVKYGELETNWYIAGVEEFTISN